MKPVCLCEIVDGYSDSCFPDRKAGGSADLDVIDVSRAYSSTYIGCLGSIPSHRALAVVGRGVGVRPLLRYRKACGADSGVHVAKADSSSKLVSS